MPETIELTYDLFALPSAQHRAGLAGLLIVVDTMRRRGLPNVPDVKVDDFNSARVTLTKDTLTALLNDLYDATTEEITQGTQRRGRGGALVAPIRTEMQIVRNERTDRDYRKQMYVYLQVVPKAPFLQSLGLPSSWLKLWRDVVWSTLRGIPTTRGPYEDRARGEPTKEAATTWVDLTRWKITIAMGGACTTEVTGPLYLGAQAVNAEQVRFLGSPEQSFLLHFWPVVMGVGEVRRLEFENQIAVEKSAGVAITVPDITDIEGFTDDFIRSQPRRKTVMDGYRPREAILSLPEEGGLEYLRHLTELAGARAMAGEIRYTIAGVEVYHLLKQGNTTRMLATGRIPASLELLDQYEAIRNRSRHLLYRAQVLRNLLNGRPWFDGFDRLFALHRQQTFLGREASTFVSDVARKFRAEFATLAAGEGDIE